jgi:hypothetical protein
MAYVGTFKCDTGFVMDIYDTSRIPKTTNKGHYITLHGIKEVEIWMAEQGYTDKIKEQKDIDLFIKKGWIQSYEN